MYNVGGRSPDQPARAGQPRRRRMLPGDQWWRCSSRRLSRSPPVPSRRRPNPGYCPADATPASPADQRRRTLRHSVPLCAASASDRKPANSTQIGYRASHDRGAVTVGNEAPLTRLDQLRHFADLRRALTHYAKQLARDIDAGRHPPTETLSRARSGAHPPTQALMSVLGEGGQSGAGGLGG